MHFDFSNKSLCKPVYKLCIVGSGPSGCYLAKSIFRNSEKEGLSVKIHMLDSLSKPYGLIRYGVSPDKIEIKRLMKNFDNTLFKRYSDRIKFIGNVTVGYDVTINDLRKKYDALVLAVGGVQSFNSLKIRNIDKQESNEKIGGIFPSRDWVLYYNNHPKFRNILNINSVLGERKTLKSLNQNNYYTGEFSHLEEKCNLYFENKNPLSGLNDKESVEYSNSEIYYGYTSTEFRNYILNSKERNAVIIGNGNVALDIARLLSFYSYFQLSKSEYINPDYLNLIKTFNSGDASKIDYPLFQNIYIIGRRAWIYNSFKYQLIKELLDKSRKTIINRNPGTRNIRVMMSEEDFNLSQDPNSESECFDFIEKRRREKMKSLFEEMVENHLEYIQGLNTFNNNFVNIHFKNSFSPNKIFTSEINIRGGSKSIRFINGIQFRRNYDKIENIDEKNGEFTIPCQLLITSLGFKVDTRQIFNDDRNFSEIQTDANMCPIFKTGWMVTESKGDISLLNQNSINLSIEIINYLKKLNMK
ncbi:hypothetical protein FG386_002648 [Cryptosporidium ryanae]|uniref:uncharacterized protein n=1 Tax=Cryptosporidium ryanae TaxID=515981 RepID=UPI00351A7FAA|nr:hypothetical protein FG386_002648 [Cryptosporidium ryanae]